MAKVLLDTNVVLDYLSSTRPEHLAAVDLLEALIDTGTGILVPAGSLKDAYYILCRKYRDERVVRERLWGFSKIVELGELTGEVVELAFSSDESDFEDGIVRATAEIAGVEAIITRDAGAFASSFVPAMTPAQYCESL